MKKKMRQALVLGMAFTMLLMCVACSTPQNTQEPNELVETQQPEATQTGNVTEPQQPQNEPTVSSKEGNADTLVVAVSTEPTSLDPQNNSLLAGMTVERQIYDTLVCIDNETGEIKPNLAAEWYWEDDLTLNMTLRDDVYFQNGEKLTSDDVIFTIQRLAEGSATASLYASFDGANSVAVDDTHVQIKFSNIYAPALTMLGNVRASIVCKSYVESVGNDEFARKPMGTGAFSFADWITGDRINLTRNESCWNNVPSYKKLVIRFVTDQTARMIELETSGVDITMELASSDIESLLAGVEGCNVYSADGYKQYWLGFNETDPQLSNVKVREAIALALDVNQMVQAAYGVSAKTMDSCLGTGLFGYVSMPSYEHNLEQAKSLLAEAGYAEGLTIDLVISQAAWNTKMAEIIQAFLSQIGITVNIQTFDGATESSMRANGEETMFIGNLTCNTGDADQWFALMTENSTKKSDRKTDATLNQMIADAKSELDVESRKRKYVELQQYVYDNVLVIPLAQAIQYYGVRNYVTGFVPDAGLIPDFSIVTIN